MNVYKDRFTEIIELICKSSPPKDMVSEWLDPDIDSDRLTDWIGTTDAPWWLQNIGVLDAAHAAAEQPIEGPEEGICYKQSPAAERMRELEAKIAEALGAG